MINVHLLTLVVHKSLLCKDTVTIIHSPLVERDLNPTGVWLCLLGMRLPHHYSPRASHSFLSVSHSLTVLIVTESVFRIAIWNRGVIMSLIAFAVLSGGVALNIRRTFPIPICPHHRLTSCVALTKG